MHVHVQTAAAGCCVPPSRLAAWPCATRALTHAPPALLLACPPALLPCATRPGPDMFFARVGKDAVIKTALLPAMTVGVKKASSEVPGLEGVKDVPLAVLAPALGVAFNAVKALIPV